MLFSHYVLPSFQLWVFSIFHEVAGTLSNENSLPRDDHFQTEIYDYVIVGGGLTGLVVANRLTEDRES